MQVVTSIQQESGTAAGSRELTAPCRLEDLHLTSVRIVWDDIIHALPISSIWVDGGIAAEDEV